MATGRMLKKNISESRRLSQLKTDSARLLWTWILPFLDRDGRFYASPDMIKGKVVPRLETFTTKNISHYLMDMAAVGLITLYEVDGEKILEYRRFNEFQKIVKDREARSLPSPDEGKIITITSRSNHDEVKTKSKPGESNLIESNLIESKLREVETSPPVDNSTQKPPKPALIEEPQPKEPDALLSELREVAEEIGTLMPDANKQRQMMLFVESNIRGSNHSAIIHSLKSMRDQLKKGDQIEKPRAYLEATLKIENGKHNARENEQRSNQFKVSAFNMSCIGDIFRKAAQSTP